MIIFVKKKKNPAEPTRKLLELTSEFRMFE